MSFPAALEGPLVRITHYALRHFRLRVTGGVSRGDLGAGDLGVRGLDLARARARRSSSNVPAATFGSGSIEQYYRARGEQDLPDVRWIEEVLREEGPGPFALPVDRLALLSSALAGAYLDRLRLRFGRGGRHELRLSL